MALAKTQNSSGPARNTEPNTPGISHGVQLKHHFVTEMQSASGDNDFAHPRCVISQGEASQRQCTKLTLLENCGTPPNGSRFE